MNTSTPLYTQIACSKLGYTWVNIDPIHRLWVIVRNDTALNVLLYLGHPSNDLIQLPLSIDVFGHVSVHSEVRL